MHRHCTVTVSLQGAVFSFGCGEYGQLGHGDDENELEPAQIERRHRTITALSLHHHRTVTVLPSLLLKVHNPTVFAAHLAVTSDDTNP